MGPSDYSISCGILGMFLLSRTGPTSYMWPLNICNVTNVVKKNLNFVIFIHLNLNGHRKLAAMLLFSVPCRVGRLKYTCSGRWFFSSLFNNTRKRYYFPVFILTHKDWTVPWISIPWCSSGLTDKYLISYSMPSLPGGWVKDAVVPHDIKGCSFREQKNVDNSKGLLTDSHQSDTSDFASQFINQSSHMAPGNLQKGLESWQKLEQRK